MFPSLLIYLFAICSSVTLGSPIIGVLSQETYSVRKYFPEKNYDSFIAASYVKFLESAGARVLPIWIGQSEEYYERALNYTNGMLLPGGATFFNEPKGYAEAVTKIYKIAEKLNQVNNYYPILGICLGMEALAFVSNDNKDLRVFCHSRKVSYPLKFNDDFKKSKLFGEVSEETLNILEKKNVTYNYHRYCLTEEELKKSNLTNVWRVISKNEDEFGKEFISTIEHFDFPFYGLQFHPEKTRYEFRRNLNIPNNKYTNIMSQYFADFFINECRRNNNKFPDEKVELNSLIYNFDPIFTGRNASTYYQLYMFTEDDFKKHQLI